MIDWLAHVLVDSGLIATAAWSWRVFVTMILPVAVERCPWADDCEGPL